MSIAICPSCGDDIKLSGRPRINQRVICPQCDALLEVIETDPVELDWEYEEEYDWELED